MTEQVDGSLTLIEDDVTDKRWYSPSAGFISTKATSLKMGRKPSI